MKGWVSLHRNIREHWIWKDPTKFQWWVDIIMTVNHEDKKVNVGMQLFDCKRGQSVMSLNNWAKRWKVSKSMVTRFFDLLKSDSMITTENLSKTTRLTVCNYDYYQSDQNANETQAKRRRNTSETLEETNNNENNVNNDNNVNNPLQGYEKFDFTFIDSDYKDCFFSWLEYKKKRGEKYRTQKSIELCYNKLKILSKNDSHIATKIIEESMANNWAGLFELQEDKNTSNTYDSEDDIRKKAIVDRARRTTANIANHDNSKKYEQF